MTASSTLASRAADIIHGSFDEYHNLFREITRRTRQRFERCDWDGIRRDTVRRLDLHEKMLVDAFGSLESQLQEQLADRDLWVTMKDAYSHEVLGRDDFELAQTFFNSLTRRVFPHDGVDPAIDFTIDEFPLPYRGWEMASARMYAVHAVTPAVLTRIIEDARFQAPFDDLRRDSELAATRIERRVAEAFGAPGFEAVDMLRPVLVRNKAAYLVGRVRRGERLMPLVLAILNRDGRLQLDAVLTHEEEASVLFSFARWYFHADIDSPREVIGFLRSLLPRKTVAELYISLGYNKHGKTEFYRDLMRYIATTEERFTVAPGVPGLVMEVFTLPSFEFVFKVIKDFFPPEKRTTRQQVRSRYREVLRHDRVGRLVDFQQFEHVKFPRPRFDEALLAQLLESSSRNVAVSGDEVIVRHMYIGRRVTPLDIYLRENGDSDASRCAVVDWGTALKELAAANIFAGDMLLKNFGVTRHGRVVFYDYDELCALASCRFRKIPPARSMDEEMSAEPWFSVGDDDIFPEELRTFLGLSGPLLSSFDDYHGDLFTVDFWRSIQERHQAGEVLDFYPYSSASRLEPAGASPATGRP
jgi:isocitrate dehydrogenase kinase/phosphatase